ncbi:MAG: hypothetical protein D6732_02640 [Methanobacteriota archaeon]|nr:MAG: hypothetical protein D6732_02640 [Euryarchaeota archaeon]
MFIIHILLIMFMAKDAFKDSKVIGIHMAIRTGIPFVMMCPGINREIHSIVIPGDIVPVIGGMALFTIGREIRGLVIGIRGVVIIILMAGKTIRWGIVVPIRVAINTLEI